MQKAWCYSVGFPVFIWSFPNLITNSNFAVAEWPSAGCLRSFSMDQALCEAGAAVVIIGSSENVLEAAQKLCAQGYQAYGLRGDLNQTDKLPELMELAVDRLGGRLVIPVDGGYLGK